MIGNSQESHGTQTPWCGFPNRLEGKSKKGRGQGSRSHQRDVRPSRKKDKFSRAFARSLVARTKQLGRRLAPSEWKDLQAAVRKQIRRRISPLGKQLSSLASRVSRLEFGNPSDLSQVSDAIALLQLQVQIMKRSVFEATEEQTRLTESCSHITNRLKISFEGDSSLMLRLPGVGVVWTKVPAVSQTICSRCKASRADAVYGWTGQEVTWKDFDLSAAEGVRSRLEERDPLDYQFIWIAILDTKFDRQVF